MKRPKKERISCWYLRPAAVGVLLVLFFFFLPLLFLEEDSPEIPANPLPTATLPALLPPVSPVEGWDEGQTLRLLKKDGTVEEITLREYLWGVTAAEMPASFHLEALKAQTVAARTYCLYQRSAGTKKHQNADICTDSTCCQAYLTREQAEAGWGTEAARFGDKITQAVTETDGLLCFYEGKPIDAVFFSSTAGKTSAAATVWGTDVPYLAAVDSPEGTEVPGWQTVVTFTPGEFITRMGNTYPEADFTLPAAQWFQDLQTDDSGNVTSVKICGVSLTGGQARSLFGLRSAHFTAAATEEEVRFWVTGYGHGVGLSQYGANALAGEGKSFSEILTWYYTGVEVRGYE